MEAGMENKIVQAYTYMNTGIPLLLKEDEGRAGV
jgi:hypothetical protein